MRDGSLAGLAEGFSPSCDPNSPGYIYGAASDPVWNPNLYVEAKPDAADTSATNTTSTASSGDTNKYESVIYAVSALVGSRSGATAAAQERVPPKIEVWWNTTIQEEGMPKALTIPTLPQVYSIRWPEIGETPQIVIASQLGSASESLYSHNSGLCLSGTNACAELPARKFFDDFDGGTIMFWMKPDVGFSGEGEASVVSFADNNGRSLTIDLNVSGSATNVVFGYSGASRKAYPFNANSPGCGEWCHVAVTVESNNMDQGKATFYVNGKKPAALATLSSEARNFC